jgi:putative heme iron utilization protein
MSIKRIAGATAVAALLLAGAAEAHHHGEIDWRARAPGGAVAKTQAQAAAPAHGAAATPGAAAASSPAAPVPTTRQTTPPPPVCATPVQRVQVAAALLQSPAAMPPNAARMLAMPELAYVGALPSELRVLVSGGAFAALWETIAAWPEAMTMIMKGPNVFEIAGAVPPGENSTRSAFFNLKKGEGALSGHLRPDLYAAAALVALKSKEGETRLRGVLFYDAAGESVFGVFLPGEGQTPPSAAAVAAFEKSWALAKTLPSVCG